MKLEINNVLYDFEEQIAKSNKQVECLEDSGNAFTFLIQGKVFHISIIEKNNDADSYLLEVNGKPIQVNLKSKLALLLEEIGMNKKQEALSLDVIAPMPGKILEVNVAEGDSLEKGQTILILEAMKMQNSIKAVAKCQITNVHAKVGESVEKGALLISCAAE